MSRAGAVAALIVTCLIWGATFPLLKLALGDISPLAFTAARFICAAAIVWPGARGAGRGEWLAGGLLGLLLGVGFAVQTLGLTVTSASRSGFITAMYIPFVPIVVFAVGRVLPGKLALSSLAFALMGMMLLTRRDAGAMAGINRGDLLTLACAVLFAIHLVYVGRFARVWPLRRLLAIQILVATAVTVVLVPLENPVHVVWSPLVTGVVVFEGLFATVLCLHLQLRAQRVIAPTHAAVVYAFEPVVAAAASMALIGERLAPLQWAGGALILLGLMVPQADENLAAETGGIRPE